ncbi:MAG: cytochrome c [Bacteroidales bacterium]|nr:cytochrome c [Deltaproteobacteria bacterium]MBL7137756.1 cytochrome c [Bacteroidales bacterium]
MKKTLIYTVTCMIAFFFVTAVYSQDAKPWVIPAKYKAMKSTVKAGDADALADGKMLWSKFCKSCHGSKGLGDGPKAAMLKTFPGDFSSAAFQKYSDGEIYYMSFIGRDEMPNFEKKITAEADRWALVAYMRTMKK